jgi:Ca2+-binding EF-hand superfamily protein
VDEDKGGTISPQELGSLMETLGLKPNQEELDAMIREIDEDGNGEIEFDEFVQVLTLCFFWNKKDEDQAAVALPCSLRSGKPDV